MVLNHLTEQKGTNILLMPGVAMCLRLDPLPDLDNASVGSAFDFTNSGQVTFKEEFL